MLIIADTWISNRTQRDVLGITLNGLGVVRIPPNGVLNSTAFSKELVWDTDDIIRVTSEPCHIGVIDTDLGSIVVPGALFGELTDLHPDWWFVTHHPLASPHQSFEVDIGNIINEPLTVNIGVGCIVSARKLIVHRITIK